MTAVDWNPRDSNQIVTCSDDNTIRIWNVKREIDKLKSNECNFCIAETINEFEEGNGRESEKIKSQSKLDQISQVIYCILILLYMDFKKNLTISII